MLLRFNGTDSHVYIDPERVDGVTPARGDPQETHVYVGGAGFAWSIAANMEYVVRRIRKAQAEMVELRHGR